jgi:hypothetical protein
MASFRKYTRFLYILVLLVFIFISHQSLQNKHAHFYNNNTIIHSHPLNGNDENPIKNHNHSKTEIYFLQIISFEYFSHTGMQYFEVVTHVIPSVFYNADEQSDYYVIPGKNGSRDPPAQNCQD